MKVNGRTYEDEDAISILLPAVDHLVVFFPCELRIHGKDWPRAVTEVGLPLLWLVRCRLRLFKGIIITGIYFDRGESTKRKITDS